VYEARAPSVRETATINNAALKKIASIVNRFDRPWSRSWCCSLRANASDIGSNRKYVIQSTVNSGQLFCLFGPLFQAKNGTRKTWLALEAIAKKRKVLRAFCITFPTHIGLHARVH
jgi:hypothetical protein